MRQVAFVIGVFAVGLLVSANPAHEDGGKKLRELHKQRITALKEVVDVLESQKEFRLVARDEVMQANLQLQRAQVEAAESKEERMSAHRNIVELMLEFEDMADQVVKRAHVDRTLHLKAKADRLKAEIDMEQEPR